MIDDILQDLRISFRSLLRAPIVTLTIVITVGLGIGATTAIFAAVNAALLRPLPYPEPERLVRIYTDNPPFVFRFSVADYLALQEQQTHFERVAGYTQRSMVYSDGTAADLLRGNVVTWTYFGVLGLGPALGRDFTEADGRPGSPPAVIVSQTFWLERLGGRNDVVGRPIRLDGVDHTLAGVLPARVGPLEQRTDFFVAAQWEPPRRKGPFLITVVARFRPEADRASAANELRAINKRLFPIWRASYQDEKATWSMLDLRTHVGGDVDTIAGLALTAVALVWLIAAMNASNLLVARVTGRRRELAVRAALGASRGRVVRHLLVESAVLAIAASTVGIALAWAGTGGLRELGAAYFPRTDEIALDGTVLWLLAALTIASALLFGVVPAVHGTGGPVDESLRSMGRSSTGSLAVRRLRRALVGSQFAIATPLLVVAALLTVTLNELRRVDLGFDSRNIITGSLRLAPAQYQRPGSVVAFFDELERRVKALPGVADVAFADGRPPNGVGNFNNFDLEQFPTPTGESQPVTPFLSTTPEYFRVLGLRMLEGRLLTDDDVRPETLEMVVVDRAWARRFFPRQSAIGKRFREGGCTTCPWTQVVGVVSDVKYAGLDQPDPGTVYTPMGGSLARFLILRTRLDSAGVVSAVRQVIRELDPAIPFSNVATMDDLVDRSLQTPRSLSLLVVCFGAVALVLSIVGIYGVMAHYVQQVGKDISIRLALGGTPREMVGLVVGQGMKVVAGGVVVGLAAALVLTRLMRDLLFGVSGADPFTLSVVIVSLLAIATIACLVPAMRAAATQPATVLRNE